MKIVRVPEWLKRPGGPISANELSGWPDGVVYDGKDRSKRKSKQRRRRREIGYVARVIASAAIFSSGVDLL